MANFSITTKASSKIDRKAVALMASIEKLVGNIDEDQVVDEDIEYDLKNIGNELESLLDDAYNEGYAEASADI